MADLCLIQPAQIGDLIITLPIAHYYHRQGRKVVMPIMRSQYRAFRYAAPYVKWIPIKVKLRKIGHAVRFALEKVEGRGYEVINMGFGFKGMDDLAAEWRKSNQNFDRFKYTIADVPFEEKWNLNIRRNRRREERLYRKLAPKKPYTVVHSETSRGHIPLDVPDENVVQITPLTSNIFDWLKILEEADRYVMLDSCFANLVNQMNFTGEKVLVRADAPDNPVMSEDWKII